MSLRGRWFRHFKGTFYMVVNEALSCEDRSPQVIYVSREDPDVLWVRSKEEFLDIHPTGVRRFEPVPYDQDGPCEPLTTIEFRQETEVVTFQIFDGKFDVQFPEVPELELERGTLGVIKRDGARPTFKLIMYNARSSNMSSDFLDRPFELRYSDDEDRMIKLKDCQATKHGTTIEGDYDYDSSEFGY